MYKTQPCFEGKVLKRNVVFEICLLKKTSNLAISIIFFETQTTLIFENKMKITQNQKRMLLFTARLKLL